VTNGTTVTCNDLHVVVLTPLSGTAPTAPPFTTVAFAAGRRTIDFSGGTVAPGATVTVTWYTSTGMDDFDATERSYWTLNGNDVGLIPGTGLGVDTGFSIEGGGRVAVRLENSGPAVAYSGLKIKNNIDVVHFDPLRWVDAIETLGNPVELLVPSSGMLPSGTTTIAVFAPTQAETEFSGGLIYVDGVLMGSAATTYQAPRPWSVYCVAQTNSSGCVPRIYGVGVPSSSAPGGFGIGAEDVLDHKSGLLFYGLTGTASVPFHGGTLCVKSPLHRSFVANSGGCGTGAACKGAYFLDMNLFAHGLLAGNPSPALTAVGQTVNCQWWSRDPGFPPPSDSNLTDALEYTVQP
jgi:hypothetical protein